MQDVRALGATAALVVRGVLHRVLRRPLGRHLELSQQQTAVIEQYNLDQYNFDHLFDDPRPVLEFSVSAATVHAEVS